jgi:hypothetical protein
MKLYLIFSILLMSLVGVSCSADSESDDANNLVVDEYQEMMDLMDDVTSSDAEKADWQDYFEMAVPAPMMQMDELNPTAIAQYGYVEEIELDTTGSSIVKEHYLIVLMELKDSIAGYPVQRELDAMIYRNDAINALLGGNNGFKDLTEEPKVEDLHGFDCVRSELSRTIEGNNGKILLYYQMAIVEGNNAFYQILTWCVDEQRDDFEYEMEKIINSFKEI